MISLLCAVAIGLGEYNDYLAEVVGTLYDEDVLFEAGLLQDEEYADRGPVRLEEDEIVSKAMLDLVRTTFDEELRHMRYFSDRPPYKYCACLSRDVSQPKATIGWNLLVLRLIEGSQQLSNIDIVRPKTLKQVSYIPTV